MVVVVIRNVLHTVLITHVQMMMENASVFKDITVNVVKELARTLAKPAVTMHSVLCVLLANADHYVPWTVTATVVHVISRMDSVMNN